MNDYPKEWERHVTTRDGKEVLIRPIRRDDEALYPSFLAAVTPEDLRLRFFAHIKEFDQAAIARFTHVDYDQAMAFVAVDLRSGAVLGVARLHANPDHDTAEFAVLVRSALKGKGLGWILMETIIEYADSKGLRIIEGQVLRENAGMLRMCQELGFTIAPDPQDAGTCMVQRIIGSADAAPREG